MSKLHALGRTDQPAPSERVGRRGGRAIRTLGAVAFLLVAVGQIAPASAAPEPTLFGDPPPMRDLAGSPGDPGQPTDLYVEDFEHEVGLTPVNLPDYVGSGGVVYTADAPWLRACNGVVISWSAPDDGQPLSNCTLNSPVGNATAYGRVRQIAHVLGQVHGVDPLTNHALSAYTDGQHPGADHIEFRTAGQVPLGSAITSRYLGFSVDAAAANCAVAGPVYRFGIVEPDGDETPVAGRIDVCASGKDHAVGVRGGAGATTLQGGTYYSSEAFLFSGSSLGVVMRNATRTGNGNDAGFDNLRVVDVTPQLDKSFAPATIRRGETSMLTLTITNREDLGAKTDWAFTDNLPAGVVVSPTPDVGGTCAQKAGKPFVVTALPGGTSIAAADGDLAIGEASCTITVGVSADQVGTYTNGPANITGVVGLLPPADATLEVVDPSIDLVKTAGTSSYRLDDTITYTFVATNTGTTALADVTIVDPLPGVSALSCTPALGAALAVDASMTCHAIKVATAADVSAGSITNTATVTGTDPGGGTVRDVDDVQLPATTVPPVPPPPVTTPPVPPVTTPPAQPSAPLEHTSSPPKIPPVTVRVPIERTDMIARTSHEAPPKTSAGSLPVTGASSFGRLLTGLGVLAAGLVLVGVGRRRATD